MTTLFEDACTLAASNHNSAFAKNSLMQIAWDATSLGALKTCPMKYFYTIILGYRPKTEASPLTFGSFFHKGLEIYDHIKAQGHDHNTATHEAIKQILPEARKWESTDPNRNYFTLIRSLIWYMEEYKNDPCKTVILSNGKPAVELSFRFELPYQFENSPLMLCGHMDRLVEFQDKVWVSDRKTTKGSLDSKFFNSFSPDNQMSLYPSAAQVFLNSPATGVIIDGAQVGVNFTRFARGFAHRNKDLLDEWMQDTYTHIGHAAQYAASGRWPMNDKACSNFGSCPFREVCSKPECVRKQFLSADFKQEFWKPLEIRGDV